MTGPTTPSHRTQFRSLGRGGLDWDGLPLRLFLKGQRKHWVPSDIDFTRDAEDWRNLSEAEQFAALMLAAQFIAGEEAVTEDLQPFLRAMAHEGRLGDEMYLTQFLYEEAKHVEVFRRWLDAVGARDDLESLVADNPGYRAIFYEQLPATLHELDRDPSPAQQIRASVTYNHVVEGTLALTGYHAWHTVCARRDIFPGMQELVRRIGDDERRHMAWGTHLCRRHVAADDRNWQVVSEQMTSLLPHALTQIQWVFERFGAQPPFGLVLDEFIGYATDRASRRLGAIESARGEQLVEVDTLAEELEETFAREDSTAIDSLTGGGSGR